MNEMKNRFADSRNPAAKYLKKNMGIIIGLLTLVIMLSVASPYFLTKINFTNVLRQVTSNALLAFAITFCLIIGCMDLTIGSQVGLSGVMVAYCMVNLNLGFIPAMCVALLVGAGCGFINGFIVSRTKIPPYIVTLAMQNVLRGAAYLIAGGMAIKVTNDHFYNFGNGYIFGVPIPVIIFAIMGIILSIVLEHSVYGRRMFAVGGNKEAAEYAGINIKSIQVRTYMISGLLAALAGIIVASRVYSGQPTSGTNFEADAIAAAVLGGTSFTGGRGSIGGTVIGILIIGVVANGLNLLEIPYYWQMVIKGLIILLAVFFDTRKQAKIK